MSDVTASDANLPAASPSDGAKSDGMSAGLPAGRSGPSYLAQGPRCGTGSAPAS